MVETTISADKYEASEKGYAWSYKYSDDYSKIIFTNNNEVPVNFNFEGSFQIVYKMTAAMMLSPIQVDLISKLNNTRNTNSIKFSFASTNKDYYIDLYTSSLSSLDGLPSNANDYIWVKAKIKVNNSNSGIKLLYRKNDCTSIDRYPKIKLEIPSNAILLDSDMNKETTTNGVWTFEDKA